MEAWLSLDPLPDVPDSPVASLRADPFFLSDDKPKGSLRPSIGAMVVNEEGACAPAGRDFSKKSTGSLRSGSLIEVAGGNGSPEAVGSFYEGVIVKESKPGRYHVRWCFMNGDDDDDGLASVEADELLEPQQRIRGETFETGDDVEVYWPGECSWWEACVVGTDTSGYIVRWKHVYGDEEGPQEAHVRGSAMRCAQTKRLKVGD